MNHNGELRKETICAVTLSQRSTPLCSWTA